MIVVTEEALDEIEHIVQDILVILEDEASFNIIEPIYEKVGLLRVKLMKLRPHGEG